MSKTTKIFVATSAPGVGSTQDRACLILIYPTGAQMGTRFTLGRSRGTLGRSRQCEVLVDDVSISRQHAGISWVDGEYFVTDLQSTNGTFVNNSRVEGERRLVDGDYLRVGSHIFRFLGGGNVEAGYHEEIYRLAIIDALTECHNKRYLLDRLGEEVGRASRYERPLSLVLFDVDHFKLVNDSFGHLFGDTVLRDVARRVRKIARKDDLFARYGGEEFAVVLPETNLAGAAEMGERLRVAIADLPFVIDDNTLSVTVSIGAAAIEPGRTVLTDTELLALADLKLYEAKKAGRNRVAV